MKTTPTELKKETLPTAKAHYVMIGGFLGAGKTTAVGKLAKRLAAQGIRVGLITNDQGRNLVDTAMLRSQGFNTEEIPGGCFCCRFPSLVEASQRLTATTQPQVLVAEPVGSCTDLAATVTYPQGNPYSGHRHRVFIQGSDQPAARCLSWSLCGHRHSTGRCAPSGAGGRRLQARAIRPPPDPGAHETCRFIHRDHRREHAPAIANPMR